MVVSTTSPWDQLPREIRDRIYFFAYQNKVPYPVMLKGNLGTGRRASRYLWTEDDVSSEHTLLTSLVLSR